MSKQTIVAYSASPLARRSVFCVCVDEILHQHNTTRLLERNLGRRVGQHASKRCRASLLHNGSALNVALHDFGQDTHATSLCKCDLVALATLTHGVERSPARVLYDTDDFDVMLDGINKCLHAASSTKQLAVSGICSKWHTTSLRKNRQEEKRAVGKPIMALVAAMHANCITRAFFSCHHRASTINPMPPAEPNTCRFSSQLSEG